MASDFLTSFTAEAGSSDPENHPLIVVMGFFYEFLTPHDKKNLIIELAKYIKTYII